MTRHYGALLTLVSVFLWATALSMMTDLAAPDAFPNAFAPAACAAGIAVILLVRRRLIAEDPGQKRFNATVAVSLLAALAMVYLDAYAMNGELLHGITAPMAFADKSMIPASSFAAAFGIIHPFLYAVAAFPRLFAKI